MHILKIGIITNIIFIIIRLGIKVGDVKSGKEIRAERSNVNNFIYIYIYIF